MRLTIPEAAKDHRTHIHHQLIELCHVRDHKGHLNKSQISPYKLMKRQTYLGTS